jgi:hypothetical protein
MCLRSKLPEALMARPDKETRKRLEGNRAAKQKLRDEIAAREKRTADPASSAAPRQPVAADSSR